ncbi:hypothetical protein TRFO_39130 [Tritrichomonas foetus]|uniref:Uncharacterized protein n=1 Tax=Tritrichomonas foetus TaxID=1144522 RepID=A0A1J4J7Q3_9EUKA|nr:hypothetical protein TRFO_39130 [Tritrichomonas foetus]|eukprot:OHS94689.1 hypothetical protein TRFO_39130 [Tritrichomonas foetus]
MNTGRRNYSPQAAISKLDLWIIEPQGLKFGSCTADYQFESFGQSLHLNPPQISYRLLPKPNWYSGIPISMVVVANNMRFQPISNSTIEVSVYCNNRIIFTTQSSTIQSIDGQNSISFPFRFVPPSTTSLKLIVTFNYTFESQFLTNSIQTLMQIYPSIVCKLEQKEGFLGYEIENQFPFPISNVTISSGSENEPKKLVAEKLIISEKVFGFIKKTTTFEIRWSLPFANDCVLTCPVKNKNSERRDKVKLQFLEFPKIVKTLSPFEVKIKLMNKTCNKLKGSIQINHHSNEKNKALNESQKFKNNKASFNIPVSLSTPNINPSFMSKSHSNSSLNKGRNRTRNRLRSETSESSLSKMKRNFSEVDEDIFSKGIMMFDCVSLFYELDGNQAKEYKMELISMKDGTLEFPEFLIAVNNFDTQTDKQINMQNNHENDSQNDSGSVLSRVIENAVNYEESQEYQIFKPSEGVISISNDF